MTKKQGLLVKMFSEILVGTFLVPLPAHDNCSAIPNGKSRHEKRVTGRQATGAANVQGKKSPIRKDKIHTREEETSSFLILKNCQPV